MQTSNLLAISFSIDLLHKSLKPLPNPPVNKRLRPYSSPLLGEKLQGGEGVRFLPPVRGGIEGG